MDSNNNENGHLLHHEPTNLCSQSCSNKWLIFDLCLISYFSIFCSTVPCAFYSREVIKKGGTIFQASVIQQVHFGVTGITGIFFGKYILTFGYKRLMLFGVILESFSQIAFAFTGWINNITVFVSVSIFVRIFSGLGNSATATSVFAITINTFNENTGTVLSILQAVKGSSYMLGSAVGAALFAVTHGMELPLLIPGIAFVLSCIRFAIFYEEKHEKKSTSMGITDTIKHLRHKQVIISTFVLILLMCTFGYIDVLFTLHMQKLGYTVTQTGLIFLFDSLGYILSMMLTGYVNRKWDKSVSSMMVLGCIGCGTVMFCFIITNELWLITLGITLFGCFSGMAMLSSYNNALNYLRTIKLNMPYERVTGALSGLWVSFKYLSFCLHPILASAIIHETSSYALCYILFTAYYYTLSIVVIIAYYCIR